MTEVLSAPPQAGGQTAPAEHLRRLGTACRLSFTWLGVRKTLSARQKAQAAEPFGAEARFLSAAKRLWDTSHPAYRAVTRVRHQTRKFWQQVSLPFPEPGLRLVRQEEVPRIDQRLRGYQARLHQAVAELDRHYGQLRRQAQQRLGSLYQPADYPPQLAGLFDLSWEFPSVEPPSYLARLAPEVYQQECRRVQARFEEAVRLAEEAFTEELRRLVAHLLERLTPGPDGQAKVFRDSVVAAFGEFFERFRRLSIRSHPELDRLVADAQAVMRGLPPQRLRDSRQLRTEVARQLTQVKSRLEELLVERPRRQILRRRR